MEAEHLASTANNSSPSNVTTSVPSTQTVTQTNPGTLPVSMPGPSGLSRLNTRPTKRPNNNIHIAKSDSSTVYQSDSSSSSDSDESPTPKRRISLVPNSNLFRKNELPKVADSSTSTYPTEKFDKRKKLFLSRTSAFHLTRSSSTQSLQTGSRNDRERHLTNDRERHPQAQIGFMVSAGGVRRQASGSRNLHAEPRRTVTTEEYLNMYPDLPG